MMNKTAYECDMCDKTYQSKYHLSNHTRSKHSIVISSNEIEELSTSKKDQETIHEDPIESLNDDSITDSELKDALDDVEMEHLISAYLSKNEEQLEAEENSYIEKKSSRFKTKEV